MGDPPDAATASTLVGEPSGPPSVDSLRIALELDKTSRALFGTSAPLPTFGRYEVRGHLGRGGMGTVFEAYDPTLDRSVAIKVLHPDIADAQSDRLIREAKALAKLSHPNVVQVYEVGKHEDKVYVAMELVRGQTLQQWHAQPQPWREAVGRYMQAGRALAAAHRQGLVHRDFKPGNCIVDEEGRVRVLDFGLVRSTDGPAATETSMHWHESLGADTPATPTTGTGTVLGTLPYMPPEQLEGAAVDARADQFSFCVALHEAIFGVRPVPGATVHELASALQQGARQQPPKHISVPSPLLRTLARGTAHDPAERFPSMEALVEALGSVVRPRRWKLLAATIVVGGAVLGAAVFGHDEPPRPCAGADEHLQRIWDDDRRGSLETALLETGLAYAPQTSERVLATLDGYAAEWVEQHTEACEATVVRKEQPEAVQAQRMRCLDRARRSMDGAVGLLVEDASATIQSAAKLLDALPDPTECGNLEALALEVPQPDDPGVAARAEEVRDQLGRVSQLSDAGQYEQAQIEAAQAVTAAEQLGYKPVVAEALVGQASILGKTGDLERQRSNLERAHAMAIELDHQAVQISATALLCFSVGVKLERPDEAKPWCDTAVALAKRTSATPLQRLRAGLYRVSARQIAGAPADEVAAELEALVELADSEPSLAGLQRATVVAKLASERGRQSRYREAVALSEEVLAIRTERLGALHPLTAMAHHNLASRLESVDEHDASADHLRSALSIYTEVYGPGHYDVGRVHFDWGLVEHRLGHPEKALEHYAFAQESFAAAVGEDGLAYALTLINRGAPLNRLGRHTDALESQTRAGQILRTRYGAEHRHVGAAEYAIGATLGELGRHDEALPHLMEAQRIYEAAYGPDSLKMAEVLNSLSTTYGWKGQYDQELAMRQRTIEIATEAVGRRHHETATFLHNFGRTQMKMGRFDEAKATLNEALAISAEQLGRDHEHVARAELSLAETYLAAEDPAGAVPHAERSLEIRERAGFDAEFIADSRFILAKALWHQPGRRTEARKQAEEAVLAYRAVEATGTVAAWLPDVEAWLAERPVPR